MSGSDNDDCNPRVAILLSAFNGEKFISEQVASLLKQSYRNIKIYIRDDGSTDRTLDIINGINNQEVELVGDELGNLGPSRSFFRMLSDIRADIYMFCDQDDYWLPEKVQQAVSIIGEIRPSEPILFHTDLKITDSSLESLGESFNVHQGIYLPADHEFSRMLIQNCVVGCTVAMTDALVEKSKIRDLQFDATNVAMHDWWMALCAINFGKILFSDNTYILYRRHSSNVSAIRNRGKVFERLRMLISSRGAKRIAHYKSRIGRQAKYFLDIYGGMLAPEQVRILRGVSKLSEGSGIKGILFCVRNRIFFRKLYMNLSFLYVSIFSIFIRKSQRE